MSNYFTDSELDDEIDRLCDMDPAGFAEIVDADVRGVAPAVTSAALRDPDVVDRWYEELVDMLDDIDSQVAAKESDMIVARAELLDGIDELSAAEQAARRRRADALHVEFHRWRKGALRFQGRVRDRLREARWHRAAEAVEAETAV